MRTASISRDTKETAIAVTVNLDGTGEYQVSTGIGFLDHMIEQLSRHSLIDISLSVKGDLHVDQHHTVEDSALALGEALARALGDKRGIARYGEAHAPMDETLTSHAMPTNLPHGWDFEKVFGEGSKSPVAGMFRFMPLDGTLFRDSRSVDTKHFVGMATIGLTARRRDMVFFLGRTSVTNTFDGERKRADFGTASWQHLVPEQIERIIEAYRALKTRGPLAQ